MSYRHLQGRGFLGLTRWGTESKLLPDKDGVGIVPRKRVDVGGYKSLMPRGGVNLLWRPERKFFQLGTSISEDLLANMEPPR